MRPIKPGHDAPTTTPTPSTQQSKTAIIRLRKTLTKQGYDAGADTIAEHLTVTQQSPKCLLWRQSGVS